MNWLNYGHLLYFLVVAREGSIKQTCEVLSLSQPAQSVQLRALENSIGEKLFGRIGRKLVRTDVGSEASRYVEKIFTLGREFSKLVRLVVGIAEVVP